MTRQPDLFDERGGGGIGPSPQTPAHPALPAPAMLSDEALVARVADGGLSDIHALCREVAVRSLASAVPALERLWSRFHGFGVGRPLREQVAVLETLAGLEYPEARAALRRIVLDPSLPASFWPTVLRAAAEARLFLPAAFVADFLGHADMAVRRAAFDLAPAAKVPAHRLREGLFDGDALIRVTAAAALAQLGDAAGLDALLAELARSPTSGIIDALGMIGGDEVIVALGRCAMRHAAFVPVVIAVLSDMGDPRADRLADRLRSEPAQPNAGRTS
ncbi:MAG: hypothetical protein OXD42_10390 [Rhodospirillaceae bacterium]|nr:hypothetical protein [Rhodospirillaceae bacterium]